MVTFTILLFNNIFRWTMHLGNVKLTIFCSSFRHRMVFTFHSYSHGDFYWIKFQFYFRNSDLSNEDNMNNVCNRFKSRLHDLNDEKARFVDDLYSNIVHNTIGHVRYHFIDASGPQYGEVTHLHSISVR